MGKFSDFLESNGWVRFNGFAYGVGAAVVIIGALFKILHLKGAGAVLTIGMVTEAFLFFMSAFSKPHKEYNWALVYPQLDQDDKEKKPVSQQQRQANKLPSLETQAVSEEDMQKLSNSIKKLTDTAGQLASFSSASGVTEAYIKNVSSASDAIGSFSNSQRNLTESSAVLVDSFKGFASNMSAVSTDSKAFMEKMSALNQTLSSVNSTYELQLKNMTTQADAFNAVNSSLQKINSVMDSSVKETEAYKEQTAKLTQQVSSLNSIYGNMLNAMNVRS